MNFLTKCLQTKIFKNNSVQNIHTLENLINLYPKSKLHKNEVFHQGFLQQMCLNPQKTLKKIFGPKYSMRQGKDTSLSERSTLHKKWSFSLRISSVNVTKFKRNCSCGHIYWKSPWWNNSFFARCNIICLLRN